MPVKEIPADMPDNPALESALAKSGVVSKKKGEQDDAPVYRMMHGSHIPVSKFAGMLWQSRKDQGLASQSGSQTCWAEAIRYYENDQTTSRTSRTNSAGNQSNVQQLNNQWTETENVVFANCSIMVPMLYAKNPTVTATTENDALTDLCKAIGKLGNKLMSMKTAPGLNFKIKLRRAILTALLTNSAFFKIGWTAKEDATEAALAEMDRIGKELATATSKKKVLELEGQLIAIEEKVSLLSPSGPWGRNLSPDRIVCDPTGLSPDPAVDSNWLMEWDMLPTSYINAVYATKEDQQYRSVYEPTHVLNAGGAANGTEGNVGEGASPTDDVVNNFVAIKSNEDATAAGFGYSNQAAYRAACYTKVWYVWDKITRRVYMYADNKWSWPIWVWDDPLKLPRFFPYFRLWFHESTNSNAPKGEVTYYLDQQDAINEISDESRRARAWAKRNIFYDKNRISQEDVEKVMSGPDGTARGVEVPEGLKLSDVIFSFTSPALKFPELFDKNEKFAAINRITGINDAMRGAQFKTNTTNKAIDNYNQAVEVRTDEKVDLIEDFIADVMWNICMLCLMNWEATDVLPLIGSECAQYWQKITDNRIFDSELSLRVEGGSIGKPNSREKKKESVELGQVLGQFANAAPGLMIPMLRIFERSFDEFVVTDEEWKFILQTVEQSMMKAGGGPGAEGQQQQQQGGGNPQEAEIRAAIEQLPPAGKQMLQQLVQGGMPPAEALKKVIGATQTQQ